MTMNQWLNIVFDEGDSTCFTDAPTGMVSTRVQLADSRHTEQYMCINALDGTRDRRPEADWHSADVPRRADVNVVKLRTFLVEFDRRELVDQIDFVEASGMPYSLMTFSGGKSIHFLICLQEPLKSVNDYRSLVSRIYSALGGKAVGLDEQNKNPSRLTRTPGGIRQPSKITQELLEVRGRVSVDQLEAWLTEKGFSKQAHDEMVAKKVASRIAVDNLRAGKPGFKGLLKPETQNFLMIGAQPGQWNVSFFKAACDLAKCGYSEAEVLDKLERAHGPLEKVTVSTIMSALRRVEAEVHDELR